MQKSTKDALVKVVVVVILLLFMFSIILPILPFARGR